MRRLTLVAITVATIFFVIALAYPTDIPETLTLDILTHQYGPVEFSHGYHAEMSGDCASCHHHSEEGSTPACGECHEPITVYQYYGAQRETSIGLKGAYHNQCLSCHREMESGPVGCFDCHEKEEAQ